MFFINTKRGFLRHELEEVLDDFSKYPDSAFTKDVRRALPFRDHPEAVMYADKFFLKLTYASILGTNHEKMKRVIEKPVTKPKSEEPIEVKSQPKKTNHAKKVTPPRPASETKLHDLQAHFAK